MKRENALRNDRRRVGGWARTVVCAYVESESVGNEGIDDGGRDETSWNNAKGIAPVISLYSVTWVC